MSLRNIRAGRPYYQSYALHAPHPGKSDHPYCREHLLEGAKTARKEETITCKACIRKLARNVQYHNFLIAQGFKTNAWTWSGGGQSKPSHKNLAGSTLPIQTPHASSSVPANPLSLPGSESPKEGSE
jgi:hypothetical protein